MAKHSRVELVGDSDEILDLAAAPVGLAEEGDQTADGTMLVLSFGCVVSAVPTIKSVLIESVAHGARRGRVQWHVRVPRFPAPLLSPLPSGSGRSARREPGTPSSASCAAARAPKPSSAIAILRPTRLGLALQNLVQLALRPVHCETRDRHRLAPPRLSAVLEMEKQSSSGSTVGADRSPKPDPNHEFSESTLGRTSPSWGTPETRHPPRASDSCQVHGSPPQATLANLEDLPT